MFYSITTVRSSVFHVLFFPREGKIDTIDQLDYCVSSTQLTSMMNYVPLVADNPRDYERVGVGLFKISSLIGAFPLPLYDIPSSSTTTPMHMIFFVTCGLHMSHDP